MIGKEERVIGFGKGGNVDKGGILMMEVDYPSEEAVQGQKAAILAAVPKRGTVWDRIREVYWEPGFRVVFYQCGSAWFITGMVYILMLVGCILTRNDVKARAFFALMTCPMLYLVFFFMSLWSEGREAVELKRTMYYSFNRLVDLRMFYSSIVMTGFDLVLLPAMGKCSLQEIWAVGAAGVSSSFMFALFSLYLYRRIGNCGHIGIMVLIWIVMGAGVARYGDVLYRVLFEDLPAVVHTVVAVCCLVGFMDYIRRGEKNAYA